MSDQPPIDLDGQYPSGRYAVETQRLQRKLISLGYLAATNDRGEPADDGWRDRAPSKRWPTMRRHCATSRYRPSPGGRASAAKGWRRLPRAP